jgi:hypothetical protein
MRIAESLALNESALDHRRGSPFVRGGRGERRREGGSATRARGRIGPRGCPEPSTHAGGRSGSPHVVRAAVDYGRIAPTLRTAAASAARYACNTAAITLAVLILPMAVTSGAAEKVPTGGELTRYSRCRPLA